MLIGVCTILEMVCLLVEHLKKPKIVVRRIQKVSFACSDICGVVMIINVLFWQFYRFWGC